MPTLAVSPVEPVVTPLCGVPSAEGFFRARTQTTTTATTGLPARRGRNDCSGQGLRSPATTTTVTTAKPPVLRCIGPEGRNRAVRSANGPCGDFAGLIVFRAGGLLRGRCGAAAGL
jgi:hypothetical protein